MTNKLHAYASVGHTAKFPDGTCFERLTPTLCSTKTNLAVARAPLSYFVVANDCHFQLLQFTERNVVLHEDTGSADVVCDAFTRDEKDRTD